MNSLTELLAQVAWKGTVILGAGFAAAWLPVRTSAAFRHYCWTMTLALLLALPVAIAFSPKWSLPLPASPSSAATAPVTTLRIGGSNAAGPVPMVPARNPVLWIYGAGCFAVLMRFAAGALRTRRLLAGSAPLSRPGIPRRVRVVESPHAPVPLVWGIRRPVIALPLTWRRWPDERLRAVLLHELIHVQRRDLLAQVTAQAACCLYWFHPLAWIALREQRRERERACDDAVLERGIGAAEYAGHLVDLVRGLSVQAPAMAEAGDFEGRVRALLDRGRNRAPLGRGMALAVSLLALILIVPMACMTSFAAARAATAALPTPVQAIHVEIPEGTRPLLPTPVDKERRRALWAHGPALALAAAPAPPAPQQQNAVGALAGVVNDPSGARIPGARIHLRNLEGNNEESVVANPAGEFLFSAIPAGRYEMEVRAPGFKIAHKQAVVVAGSAARADAFMEVGEISETATVVGSRPAVAAPRAAIPPQRIPIGGNVQPSKLLSQARPVYPDDLQQQGVTGTVIIRAVVGKEGQILNPRVINTDVHPGLAKAALDAVGKWLYEPSKLNGQPIEVLTTIQITFELDQ